MLARILFAVFLLNIVYKANSAHAPFITKCKLEDSKCIKAASQVAIPIFAKGIPELGVETLEPFVMKSLDASSKGLTLKLKDISGTGLSECVSKKMEIQPEGDNLKMVVKIQCTVDLKGQYDMHGVLLILPIEGNGNAHVLLRKLVIQAEADLGEKTGKDGEKHWTIKNWKHSYDLKDKSSIELENLFNGNEVLGRAARELIATSSNEIVKEVGPPIVKAIVGKIVKNVEAFFENVPASELYIA